MSTEVASTLAAMDNWPVDDQLALLHGLWERLIDAGWLPTLSDEQKAELDRRLDDLNAHPENVLSWEQVNHAIARLER